MLVTPKMDSWLLPQHVSRWQHEDPCHVRPVYGVPGFDRRTETKWLRDCQHDRPRLTMNRHSNNVTFHQLFFFLCIMSNYYAVILVISSLC